MKKFKLIPAVTFLVVVITYLSLNVMYSDDSAKKTFTDENIAVFQKLSEDEQGVIANFTIEEYNSSEIVPDSIKEVLNTIQPMVYVNYQKEILQRSTLAKYLHNSIRLILALFLFFTLYLKFTREYKFRLSFSKGLFEAVKLVLLFGLFVVSSTLLSQYLLGDGIENLSIIFQSLFIQYLKILKIGGMYGVFVAVFLYFHPQNITRYEDKARKRAENEKKAAKQTK